jgi:hypothetical protein
VKEASTVNSTFSLAAISTSLLKETTNSSSLLISAEAFTSVPPTLTIAFSRYFLTSRFLRAL